MTSIQEDLIGTWSSDEPGSPQLTFADDGTVQGTDGCNGISTTYKIEEDRVTVEPFASTLKACAGVDDWLRSVSEITTEGDLLLVHNDAGDELGTLEREQE